VAKTRRHPYAQNVNRIALLVLLAPLSLGCHKDKDAEGPMERAGKNVDKAAEKTGEALETAAEKTGEVADKAADKTGAALEKAGKKPKGDEATPAAPAASSQPPAPKK
jgi:hypothetical protein